MYHTLKHTINDQKANSLKHNCPYTVTTVLSKTTREYVTQLSLALWPCHVAFFQYCPHAVLPSFNIALRCHIILTSSFVYAVHYWLLTKFIRMVPIFPAERNLKHNRKEILFLHYVYEGGAQTDCQTITTFTVAFHGLWCLPRSVGWGQSVLWIQSASPWKHQELGAWAAFPVTVVNAAHMICHTGCASPGIAC